MEVAMMHPNERDNPIAVVDRIATIVNCIAEQETAISVGEIARRTGLPKSTTSRIARSLVPHGLLEFQDDGLVLGLRFFELGERASRPRTLRRLTFMHMEELRRTTGHTVHLAVLDGPHVVYIEILRSRNTPMLRSRVGRRVPAHATALGKALLAFSDPNVAQRVIEGGLQEFGPRTITDGDQLRAALWKVRASGIAVEQEESGPGIACVAAPISISDATTPTAAISLAGPVAHMDLAACELALRNAVSALRRQASLLPPRSATL